MAPDTEDPLEAWVAALDRRHLARLTFSEVRRALSALSSLYVERRDRLASGAALVGDGKRAAFALFYAPLHFLAVRGIVRSLGLGSCPPARILDLGCGTGAAGAAWVLECRPRPALRSVDRSGWAVDEARWNHATLGLHGEVRCGDLSRVRPREGEAVLAAFVVNELEAKDREILLTRLFAAARRGSRILVVEPIARRGFPWWESWSSAFLGAGGRSDEWRFPAELPEKIRLLDRAAGMDHREILARSLVL